MLSERHLHPFLACNGCYSVTRLTLPLFPFSTSYNMTDLLERLMTSQGSSSSIDGGRWCCISSSSCSSICVSSAVPFIGIQSVILLCSYSVSLSRLLSHSDMWVFSLCSISLRARQQSLSDGKTIDLQTNIGISSAALGLSSCFDAPFRLYKRTFPSIAFVTKPIADFFNSAARLKSTLLTCLLRIPICCS